MKLLGHIAAALLLTLGLPARAAEAHGGETGITVFPAQAAAGGQVTVVGEGLEPDVTVELHLLTAKGDEPLGEPTTDDAGHFSLAITLPRDLDTRAYELRLTARDGLTLSTFVMITEPPQAAEAPETGSTDAGGGLVLAALVGLAGLGLLVWALRPSKGHRRR